MSKAVLITGGTGFIGSHLVKQFCELDYEVFYTGHKRENDVRGKCLGYDFAKLDWTDLPVIDALIHMAAITDTTLYDQDKMFKVNVQNSTILFDAAIDHKCKNIVYASSCAVYGNQSVLLNEDAELHPLNPYAESKRLLDDISMCLYTEAKMVGLRFSNVYGPNEKHKGNAASMVSRIRDQMEVGEPRLFKWGGQRRDWVYYKDAVQAVVLAIKSEKSGIYNIGSGVSESFNKIVDIWNKSLGLSRSVIYINNPFESKYQDLTQVDISKAKNELGYSPSYNLNDGIADYVALTNSC